MTTVPTPMEFVEQLANCTDRLGFVDDACRWCRSRPSRGEPDHTFDCPVIRAQQVRDAARGAASTVCSNCWVEQAGDLASCGHCGVLFASARVSPGGGPPAESAEVRELRALYGLAKAIAEAPCPKCGHLARTATVAAVAPVPGPLVGDEGLVREVNAIVSSCRTDCKACLDLTRKALAAVDAHLATRALRPAREVAHEALWSGHRELYAYRLSEEDRDGLTERVTAAIERDRAGGRR